MESGRLRLQREAKRSAHHAVSRTLPPPRPWPTLCNCTGTRRYTKGNIAGFRCFWNSDASEPPPIFWRYSYVEREGGREGGNYGCAIKLLIQNRLFTSRVKSFTPLADRNLFTAPPSSPLLSVSYRKLCMTCAELCCSSGAKLHRSRRCFSAPGGRKS